MTSPPLDPALAVVGSIVPDDDRFYGPAFNRAAQMFQDELIYAVSRAGLSDIEVLSIEPIPAFPRIKRIFGRTGTEVSRRGIHIRLLPFVNIHPLKVLTSGLSTMTALLKWAWRHRGSPRVIHAINLSVPPGVFIWLAARLSRSRVSVSVLDVWKPGHLVPDSLARRFDFWMQRRLLPRFDGHMVVAASIADDFLSGRSVCLLEGGIAADRFASSGEAPASSGDDRFRIVLAGSLESYNGLRLVEGAMRMLPEDYELVIAGTGSLDGLAREWADRDPRIRFLGFLPFEEVLDLYQSAHLLLNARITKAIDTRYFFPSKLMELLASGTPVLSTCTGHVESEYGHVLYLLRDETPEALAARIEEIRGVADDERRELGRRAREFMLTEKTWHRQGERLADYLRREVLRVA